MDAFLPIACCVLLAAIGYAVCVWLASAALSVLKFFAIQVWILVGITVAALVSLIFVWLSGRWWLHLPIPTCAVFGLVGMAWLGLSAVAWMRRSKLDSVNAEGKRHKFWPILSLVVSSTLFLAVNSVLYEAWATTPPPVASGQITKQLAYEIDGTTFGFGARGFEYSVYRTPEWSGLIRQKVGGGLFQDGLGACAPNSTGREYFRSDSVRFTSGPDDHTVLMTCTNEGPSGPASSTVEVPLR